MLQAYYAAINDRDYGRAYTYWSNNGAASQQKACAAQEAGKFKDEIAPITVKAGFADATLGLITKEVTVSKDEGLRPGTTKEGIQGIKPALPGGVITAGNASQFSDGAGACVVVSEEYASRKNMKPLGRFLGFAVAGCEPVRKARSLSTSDSGDWPSSDGILVAFGWWQVRQPAASARASSAPSAVLWPTTSVATTAATMRSAGVIGQPRRERSGEICGTGH
jgi:hypothetical protein